MSTNVERDWVQEVGKPAYESIAEMVSALQVDYDRLEELRDGRDDFEIKNPSAPDETVNATDESVAAWAVENPDDAEELDELEKAAGECQSEDEARQRIDEDPLSLRVFGERVDGEWTADRFELLLTTGGPAVRIMGELCDGEPTRAWLEVQDWFKPWTQYCDADQDTLLTYARCFYFGD